MEITIGGTKYTVPDGYHELTVERQAAAYGALMNKQFSKERKLLHIVGGCIGAKPAQIKYIPRATFDRAFDHLKWYFEGVPKVKPVSKFNFRGVEYFVPEDIGEQTFGEFVDLDDTCSENQDNIWNAVPGVLAIYCREKNDPKHSAKGFARRQKAFKQLPVDLAESLSAFFLSRGEICKGSTAAYSQTVIEAVKLARTIESSARPTGGLLRLITWHRATRARKLKLQLETAGKLYSISAL